MEEEEEVEGGGRPDGQRKSAPAAVATSVAVAGGADQVRVVVNVRQRLRYTLALPCVTLHVER